MADWATISSLATAGGTLVLAIATFSSVRSANRSARIAERAFQVGLRPVLFNSNLDDPVQKIWWGDLHGASLGGGRAVVDDVDGVVYLAISLRNGGSGMAVICGWRIAPAPVTSPTTPTSAEMRDTLFARPEQEEFRAQGRDLYVPAGGVSFWQAAMRAADDPDRDPVRQAIGSGRPLAISLLYGDNEGGQRTISLFIIRPASEDRSLWLASVGRHWNLDRVDPR
jgi:hypothetical protein